MIEYQRWMDSGEPRRWQESPILEGIRDYNQVDCESTWGLRELAARPAAGERDRVRARPTERAAPAEPKPTRAAPQPRSCAARLLARADARAGGRAGARPARPAARLAGRVPPPRGEADVVADVRAPRDDGGGAVRRPRLPRRARRGPRRPPGRSRGHSGSSTASIPTQDTKLARRLEVLRRPAPELQVRDHRAWTRSRAGRAQGRPGKSLPDRLCLIPDEFVSAEADQGGGRAATPQAWEAGHGRLAGGGRPAAPPRRRGSRGTRAAR